MTDLDVRFRRRPALGRIVKPVTEENEESEYEDGKAHCVSFEDRNPLHISARRQIQAKASRADCSDRKPQEISMLRRSMLGQSCDWWSDD